MIQGRAAIIERWGKAGGKAGEDCWTMTIEQGQQLRVLWEAKGSPDCRHYAVENEYYQMGEPTGLLVCSRCGDYLPGGWEDLRRIGEIG